MRGFALRWPLRKKAERFAPTITGFAESTYAELAWQRSRAAARRWAVWGAVLGALIALVVFAPAAWLAAALASASGERVLLGDSRGTVWAGSAVVVLTAGAGSRDAASLPGRLEWSLGWRGVTPELRVTQACCLARPLLFQIRPGLGRLGITLAPRPATPGAPLGRWPAAWLAGLGTPWNTMQVAGDLRLSSPGFTLEWVQGRWRASGSAEVDLVGVSSRVSTLDTLGSYRLSVSGDPASPGTSLLTLSTLEGALRLSGSGSLGAAGLRFRGEASAEPGSEAALDNLLNIIGRRNGARSVVSIG